MNPESRATLREIADALRREAKRVEDTYYGTTDGPTDYGDPEGLIEMAAKLDAIAGELEANPERIRAAVRDMENP